MKSKDKWYEFEMHLTEKEKDKLCAYLKKKYGHYMVKWK